MPEEGKENMLIPEQQPKRYLSASEIKPIAGGAPWLYESPDDLKKIRNGDLRRLVEVLEVTQPKSPDLMRGHYLKIFDWVVTGKVKPTEAQDFLIKIGARVEELEQQVVSRAPVVQREQMGPSALEKAFLGMSKEEFFDLVFDMEKVRFADESTGLISRQTWFTEADKTPEGVEKQDLYRAVALLSEAAKQKINRTGSLDLLIPRIESVADTAYGPEIMKLTKEQMQILLDQPGVRWCLTEYARAIVLHRKIEGTTIAACPDERTLTKIRKEMARRLREGTGLPSPDSGLRRREELRNKVLTDEEARLAESIAYLLIFNSNLVESADTTDTLPVRTEVIKEIYAKEKLSDDPGIMETKLQFKERKIPNSNIIAKIGSSDCRDFCDPLSKAVSKLKESDQRPNAKHEGWGVYKTWMANRIAKGDIEGVARQLPKIFPDKIGVSYFEEAKVKTRGGQRDEEEGEEQISFLEAILLGQKVSPSSEQPFVGYYIQLAKLKAVYAVFIEEKSRVDPKTPEYPAGREVGTKISSLLQAVNMAGDKELARKMVMAMYHRDNKGSINLRPGFDIFGYAAFMEGLMSTGIRI